MSRPTISIIAISMLLLIALPLGLLAGGVDIAAADVWACFWGGDKTEISDLTRFIVLENRLPALLTALLAGGALAIAGLLMQTCFNNPLAGPSIMGISGGASLGVALVILALGGAIGLWGRLAIAGGALVGALALLSILLLFSLMVRTADALLIVGILLGYAASSAISLLNFFSTEQAVHGYVLWGMGTFAGVGTDSLALFAGLCLVLMLTSYPYAKSLNALLLGDRMAGSVGVNIRHVRTVLLLLSGALTAVVTAWCGPIGFIGLVAPHVARMLTGSSNHFSLLPATALCGAAIGLVCQIMAVLPSLSTGGVIPINAITPIVGVPIIIYVMVNRRKLQYFN